MPHTPIEFEKFKAQLGTVISSFEKAREWADLSNCLQRVKKTFDQFQNLPVPLKKDLAKRLAQCLNPELTVIHQLTLEVYDLVFTRELVSDSTDRLLFLNFRFLSNLNANALISNFPVKIPTGRGGIQPCPLRMPRRITGS